MKRIFMFGCGGIVMLIAIVVIVAAFSGGGKPKSGTANGLDSKEIRAEKGSPVKLGDFQYNVTGFSQHQSLGNQVVSETPSSGAVFLVVSYTIENQGTKTATAMASDFYLTDEANRKFEPSSRAQTALSMMTKGDLLVTQLQPGIVKQAQQVFEVPLQALQNGAMNLVIPEKGFGSRKAIIPVK